MATPRVRVLLIVVLSAATISGVYSDDENESSLHSTEPFQWHKNGWHCCSISSSRDASACQVPLSPELGESGKDTSYLLERGHRRAMRRRSIWRAMRRRKNRRAMRGRRNRRAMRRRRNRRAVRRRRNRRATRRRRTRRAMRRRRNRRTMKRTRTRRSSKRRAPKNKLEKIKKRTPLGAWHALWLKAKQTYPDRVDDYGRLRTIHYMAVHRSMRGLPSRLNKAIQLTWHNQPGHSANRGSQFRVSMRFLCYKAWTTQKAASKGWHKLKKAGLYITYAAATPLIKKAVLCGHVTHVGKKVAFCKSFKSCEVLKPPVLTCTAQRRPYPHRKCPKIPKAIMRGIVKDLLGPACAMS